MKHLPHGLALLLLIGILFLTKQVKAATPTLLPLSLDTATPIIGNSFVVTASLSGALSTSAYYFKCRIGINSSSLSDGQTFNSQTSKWLDDTGSNGAWVDMPQITTGSDGLWQGTIQCRIKSSANDEAKVVYIRACVNSNNSCGSSFQSTSFLSVNPIVPTSTPTETPTPGPTSTPTPTPANSPTPTPSKTPTPNPTSTPTKKPSPTPTVKPEADLSLEEVSTATPEILGVSEETASADGTFQKQSYIPAVISLSLVGLGLGILSLALVWQKRNAILK